MRRQYGSEPPCVSLYASRALSVFFVCLFCQGCSNIQKSQPRQAHMAVPRGVLPNSPGNRTFADVAPACRLSSNTRSKWIAKKQAMTLAKAEVIKRGEKPDGGFMQLDSWRYEFGWVIMVWLLHRDGTCALGNHRFIRVGDDGVVNAYYYGE